MDARQLLDSVDLFRGLSARDVKVIANAVKEMNFAEGDVVAAQGDEGARFFIIVDGTASVTVGDHPAGKLGPGEYFGEISLIDGKPRSATVVAETPLRVLSLVSWNFAPLLRDYPTITHRLLLNMCARLRAVERSGD